MNRVPNDDPNTEQSAGIPPAEAGSAECRAARLIAEIWRTGPCLIAFSGGVDSAVVAAAAHASGLRAIAVTADSPSVSREQLATATRVAREIGISHRVVMTDEWQRDDYIKNDARRCFYCKSTLYAALRLVAREQSITVVLSGTNADDLGDYRPGIEAGSDAGVVAPLAELGLGKTEVRELASYWRLSVADRPASPCLSSRLAYGVAVTPRRLAMIEAAEQYLASQRFSPLRVRLLEGDVASVEVPREEIVRLTSPELWRDAKTYLRSLGFSSIRVDEVGFRSGSLNESLRLGGLPVLT